MLRKTSLLSKKIREFNGLKFSKPSKIFAGVFWADNVEDEYRELPQKVIDKIQAVIDDIGENGLNAGGSIPERKKNFQYKSKQKNKEQKSKALDFYSRNLIGGNRLIYDKRNIDGKDVLYIISCKGHYDDH